MKPATAIAIVFIGIVSLAHLLRLIFQLDIIVAGKAVPIWMSGVAFLATGALAIGLWAEHRKR